MNFFATTALCVHVLVRAVHCAVELHKLCSDAQMNYLIEESQHG